MTLWKSIMLRRVTVLLPISVLILACGGGGGSSTPAATALITKANAPTLAAAAATGAIRADGVTANGIVDAGGSATTASLEGTSRLLAFGLVQDAGVITPTDRLTPQTVVDPVVVPCDVSGSVTLSGTIARADTFSPGDTVNGTFAACDEGDGSVATGVMTLVVRSFSGDVVNDKFVLATDATLSDFVVKVGTQETSANGTLALTLDSRLRPILKGVLSSNHLELGVDGHTYTWVSLNASDSIDFSSNPSAYTDDVAGTLTSTTFAGSIHIQTLAVLQGLGASPPSSGVFLITGADHATIRLTALDATQARLDVDTDGDSVVDDTRVMAWAALGL